MMMGLFLYTYYYFLKKTITTLLLTALGYNDWGAIILIFANRSSVLTITHAETTHSSTCNVCR